MIYSFVSYSAGNGFNYRQKYLKNGYSNLYSKNKLLKKQEEKKEYNDVFISKEQ